MNTLRVQSLGPWKLPCWALTCAKEDVHTNEDDGDAYAEIERQLVPEEARRHQSCTHTAQRVSGSWWSADI